MNYVRTRTVVCCYRGRVETDFSVLQVACWSVLFSCGCHLQHIQISYNSSTIAADNSTGTYIIHYSY